MITYIIYAEPGHHDKVLEELKKEVQKDIYWIPKTLLQPGQSQELEAIKSAIKTLGYHLIRIELKHDDYLVTFKTN